MDGAQDIKKLHMQSNILILLQKYDQYLTEQP